MPDPSPHKIARGRLAAWDLADRSSKLAQGVLTILDAAAAAVFALCLALLLTGRMGVPALAGLAGAGLARALLAWGADGLAARHARSILSNLRERALYQALERTRGDAAGLGESLASAVDEIEALEGYYRRFAPARLAAALGPVVIALAVALASPVAAAILLFTLVPFVAIMALAGSAASSEAARQLAALSKLSGRFVDRVRALPVILAFDAAAAETRAIGAAADEVARRTLRVLQVAFVSTAALELFSALAIALVAVYCGFSLLGLLPFEVPETIDFGRAFFALALAPEFYAPLRRLAAAYHEKQLGEAAAERLGPILQGTTARSLPPTPFEAAPAIRLNGVVVDYGDHRIGPIDLAAEPRRITAIVGPTGSGKSSILAAVLGLAPIRAGDVQVNGQALPPGGSRAHWAAWAGQSPIFLPGSLVENLMAADPGVTRDEALEMAGAVGLGPLLAGRRDGGDLLLDERGSGLSGGERRRLAIARALLKPSTLLILDEPTSGLDAQSEDAIIGLIRAAASGRTVLVATHSDRLIKAADVIVRLT